MLADAPLRLLDVNRKRLACRSFGEGRPIILFTRFRGVLDDWDPAFLEALAKTFRVIPFDYAGLGSSMGTASDDPKIMARDAIDLADALGISDFIACGWDVGASAAQVATALYPERVSRTVLLGGCPPGAIVHRPSPAFADRVLKPFWDLDDETMLFFDPTSRSSRAAASASHSRLAHRRAAATTENEYQPPFSPSGFPDAFSDDGGYRDYLATTGTPILAISGNRDVACPIQNWFGPALEWRSLHLRSFPEAGHGVQHQYPEVVAECIRGFSYL